jgi:hypothetical protein
VESLPDEAIDTHIAQAAKAPSELTKIIAAGDDLLSRKLLSPAVVRKPYELKPDYSQLNHEEFLTFGPESFGSVHRNASPEKGDLSIASWTTSTCCCFTPEQR